MVVEMRIGIASFAALFVAATPPTLSLADEIPLDCLQSFKVDAKKTIQNINWTLATGVSANVSCAAGELLRQRLFVEGNYKLTQFDLAGSPAEAQKKALNAYEDLERRIESTPGPNVSGTLFLAGVNQYSKYQLVACLLTIEEAGGSCWIAAGKFFASTAKFFQKIYADNSTSLNKQQLLNDLKTLKPAISALRAGGPDVAGARARWIQTQTHLCRAIQRDCR